MFRTFRDARLHFAAGLLVAAGLFGLAAAPTHAQSGRVQSHSEPAQVQPTPTQSEPAQTRPAAAQSAAAQSQPDVSISNNSAKPSRADPYDALRNARTIFIRSKSVYLKAQALEQALVNRDEFQDWGLVVSRDEADADLVIEVTRKLFTNRFVYNVIDPRANRILMGGRIGSLGGTVEGQIADSFVKKLRRVRAGGRPGGDD